MGSPVSARGALFAVVALSAVVWSAGACRDFPCSEVVLLRICAFAIRGLVVAAADAHAAPPATAATRAGRHVRSGRWDTAFRGACKVVPHRHAPCTRARKLRAPADRGEITAGSCACRGIGLMGLTPPSLLLLLVSLEEGGCLAILLWYYTRTLTVSLTHHDRSRRSRRVQVQRWRK